MERFGEIRKDFTRSGHVWQFDKIWQDPTRAIFGTTGSIYQYKAGIWSEMALRAMI